MTTGYFGDLRDELVAATARANQKARQVPRRSRRRLLGLSIATALLPASAAIAAVWQPWTEGDGLKRLSQTEQIATGSVTGGGTWQLVTFSSSSGPCVELLFEGARAALPKRAGGCGAPRGSVASISSRSGTEFIFGEVRAAGRRVAYEPPQGMQTSTETVTDSRGHRYFVIESQNVDRDGCVITIDEAGTAVQSATVSPASKRRCA